MQELVCSTMMLRGPSRSLSDLVLENFLRQVSTVEWPE